MSKARGMPDMSISDATQDRINADAEKDTPKSQNEMFVKKNLKLEVKPIDIPPTIKEEAVKVIDAPAMEEVKTKLKRKMTDKQLEALARGRVTSAKNRVERAKTTKRAKAIASNTPTQSVEPVTHQQYIERPPPAVYQPQPAPPTSYLQPTIDYDKIINGITNIYDQRSQKKLQEEENERYINNNLTEFETKIREDERVKIAERYELDLAKQKKAKAQKTTENVYNRQSVNNITENPYAYAFGLNARQNYKRY